MPPTAPTVRFLLQRPRLVQAYREPLAVDQPADLALTMVWIPPGRFWMGSPPSEQGRRDTEGPQHLVQLTGFFMGQTPITQAQWRAVATWQQKPGERWGRELQPAPSSFGDAPDSDQRPVEQVTWLEAMEFCNRVSQRTGRHYSLPSEAQWEHACRAGSTTPFAFGATLTAELANCHPYGIYGDGPEGEYRNQTTPVGLFPANAWGLQDMHGNVEEWCLDHWHDSYEGAPSDGTAWLKPSGSDQELRLLRGGSFNSYPGYCRSAFRHPYPPSRFHPDNTFNNFGLRVVCLPQGPSFNP